MKCSNCGMDLEEGAVFCPYCGSKAEEPAGENHAATEEAPVTEDTPTAPEPVVYDNADSAAPKKRKTGAAAVGIVIALLAAVIVILLVLFGGRLFSGKEKKTADEVKYVRYAKDDVLYLMDKDKKKPMELGDVPRGLENEDLYQNTEYWSTASYDSDCYYTEDGKGLYFILDDDLYYKNLKKPGEEAERIDKDVQNFYIVEDDTLVYVKGDDRRLYVSKKGTAEKVDKEIGWGVKISDDHKSAFYNKINDDDTYDCYYLNLKDLSTERILKNVDNYSYDDLDHIIFTKDGKLCVLKNLTDEEKIASDCADYSTYYDDDGNFQIMYVVGEGESSIPLYDFVDDDLALEDAKLEEPQMEDYTTVEQVQDWWGDVYDKEVTDYDAYYDALDAYYEKEDRDYYRDTLKEDTIDLSQGTLYTYNVKTGESTEIMQACFQGYVDYQLVSYVDPEDLPTYKFSELIENDKVWDLYTDIYDELDRYSKYMLISDNQTVELDIDPEEYSWASIYSYGDSQNAILELGQKETEDDYNSLYTVASISLKGKNMGEYTVIDTDVANTIYGYMDSKGRNLYYFKDMDGEVGDLYRDGERVAKNVSQFLDEVNGKLLYAGEVDSEHNELELYLDGERIARDAGYLWGYCYYYLTEKGDIYYATDVNVDEGVCSFKVNYYNGKESTTVIEDAATFLIVDDSHMFYLTDYSRRRYKGTLMFYNGRKATQIDEDVAAISAYY